jgi:uncharacterized protein involved in exopolysaccharide biosynthesis
MASTVRRPAGDFLIVREALAAFFKRRNTVLMTFAAITGVATVAAMVLPPTYRAESRLLFKFGRENIYRNEVGDDRNQVVSLNSEEILNSESNILTSRDLIAQVVSAITVEQLYPDVAGHPTAGGTSLDVAVERFGKALKVDALKKSNVMEVSLEHKDPRMAARALTMLVEDFKAKHLQAYTDPKASFLEEQLADYDRRLRESQTQLEGFKRQQGLFSLEEQRTLLLKQRTELDTDLKATVNGIAQLQQQIAALSRQLQAVPPDVALSTETDRYRTIDEAKSQLLTLQLKEQDYLRTYTESNQQVVGVRHDIDLVQNFIKNQQGELSGRVQHGQNVVYQDLQRNRFKVQADLPAQQAKAASLRRQIAQLDLELPRLDLSGTELDNLKRDVAINDRTYRTYQEKVAEARMVEDLNRQKSANVSVIQTAAVPFAPIKPRRGMYIALGAILGAVAGLGVAVLQEMSAPGASTPAAAERQVGLPVLATISLR